MDRGEDCQVFAFGAMLSRHIAFTIHPKMAQWHCGTCSAIFGEEPHSSALVPALVPAPLSVVMSVVRQGAEESQNKFIRKTWRRGNVAGNWAGNQLETR